MAHLLSAFFKRYHIEKNTYLLSSGITATMFMDHFQHYYVISNSSRTGRNRSMILYNSITWSKIVTE